MLEPAAVTPQAGAAMLEHATPQELPELPLHELREARPLAGLRRRAQEGLQVLADDLMEHRVLGVAGPIHRRDTRHSPGYRTRGAAQMPTDGYGRSRARGDEGPRRGPLASWSACFHRRPSPAYFWAALPEAD